MNLDSCLWFPILDTTLINRDVEGINFGFVCLVCELHQPAQQAPICQRRQTSRRPAFCFWVKIGVEGVVKGNNVLLVLHFLPVPHHSKKENKKLQTIVVICI